MEIYLIQHAIALPASLDPEEGLSKEGIEQAERSARGLKILAPSLDWIITSTKKRAQMTAHIFAKELNLDPIKVVESEKARAAPSPAETLQEIENYQGEKIAICGHLPSLKKIASFLLSPGDDVDIAITNCGCICIETVHLFSHRGRLLWAMTGEQLGKIS